MYGENSTPLPLWANLVRVGECFGVIRLGSGLKSSLRYSWNVISIQRHSGRVVSLKRARHERIHSQDLLAEAVEIRKFQQCRDRKPFVRIGECLNQLLTKFILNVRLHRKFESDV